MTSLTFLNVACFWINIVMACFVLYTNRHALLNKAFALYCFVAAIWSFGVIFEMSPYTPRNTAVLFYHFHAIGAILFQPAWLTFAIVFYKNRLPQKKYLLLFTAITVYLFYSYITGQFVRLAETKYYFGWAQQVPITVSTIIFFLFLTMGTSIVIFILVKIALKDKNQIKRKQARVILTGGFLAPLVFYNGILLPYLGHIDKPQIGHLYATGWLVFILYAIVKYKFIVLSSATASKEIINSMTDSLLLIGNDGRIIDANMPAITLFHKSKDEILELPVNTLIEDQTISDVSRKKDLLITIGNEKRPFNITVSPVSDKYNNLIGNVILLRDITEEKKYEEKLKHIASHDALTNLPNRFFLKEYFQMTQSKARRYNLMFGILLLDLDKFKEINDTLGHHAGDLLLVQVAERMKSSVREYDIVTRMGGDEFVIIISEIQDLNDIDIVSSRVLNSFENIFNLYGKEIYVKPSIGISIYPNDGDNIEVLLKNADMAMYQSKKRGGNAYTYFSQDIQEKTKEKLDIKNMLYNAVKNNELILNYQPLYDINTKAVTAVESLLRWNHPDMGYISPLKILSLADETDLIFSICKWSLQEACRQCKAWQNEGLFVPVSVNLTARQFKQKNMISYIYQALAENKLDPKYLIIELTESTIVEDIKETITILNELKKIGIQIYIDDFGSGYFSISWLKQIPVSAIKIDSMLVKNIANDINNIQIIKAIITMAHSLNLEVIAEGVENADQLAILKSLDYNVSTNIKCDKVQGYYFSKPLSPADLSSLIKTIPRS